jgi:hypothetical protein
MNVENYHYITGNIENSRCPEGSPEENNTMDLDETVAFVEAREIGKRDLLLLGGGPFSGQVNTVQVKQSAGGVVKKVTVVERQRLSGR